MIPVRLAISGFLSYQEPAELDFTGIHVACISGRNGAGKSAMLDAITWALFGEARKNDDSIINDSEDIKTAKVDFEFIYENTNYLVRRQKTKGKSVIAEFFIRGEDGESWKPLTEKRAGDTNKRICSTLHMDYKTFINASFFLQGKADQFTGQNAAERKKILSTILNLDVWETYKAKAAEKRKLAENNALYIKGLIDEAEAELKQGENQLSIDQKAFQEKQQLVVSAERMLAQAQVEVTRQDDRLEALKKRIEDDLGMVNFMYDEKIEGQNTLPLGEMVSELPKVDILSENLEDQIQRLKNHLRRMGAVNPEAITEFAESSERYEFLKTQMADLKKADADLQQVIAELDRMMENAFLATFDKVQGEFKQMFVHLFGGGGARLVLTDPNDVNSSGIEIEAKLPGHREQELSLLSGGERSLTSVALIFSLLRVSPTPFCVMDEVDAALDEANVGRFCDLLKELSNDTQFLLITHNRNTVEASNVIYGITMSSDSTSQVVSLKLDEIKGDLLK